MTHLGKLDTWGESAAKPSTEAEIHAARLFVCARATDAAEAAMVLDALGIGASS